MDRPLSRALHERAQKLIVGGVNSPVRAFSAVGLPPLFIDRAEGQYIQDVDGNRYLDYLMSWGAIILGHAHPDVRKAVQEAAAKGSSFGLSAQVECELAEIIKEAFPSIDLLRLVNSGTEAVMSAVHWTVERPRIKALSSSCRMGGVDSTG